MPERTPPRITTDTPIGPDVDVDREDIQLADGTRLTEEIADLSLIHISEPTRPY